jgi:ABC-type sugar transport system ATPase subunit
MLIDSMRVKTPGHHTQIGSLSGGNQQKVIIGRWLLTNQSAYDGLAFLPALNR